MGVLFSSLIFLTVQKSSPSKKNVARVMNFSDKGCLTDQNIGK